MKPLGSAFLGLYSSALLAQTMISSYAAARSMTGGGKPFVADVALQGDRMAVVGDLKNPRATAELDVRGFENASP